MKRCPQCGREYDSSMMFCLDDGAELLYGPASGEALVPAADEPTTAILHSADASGDAVTRNFSQTTDQSVALSGDQTRSSTRSGSSRNLIVAVAGGVLLFAALGIGGYSFYIRSGSKQIESIAVMPFINESGNVDVEYLSDGMTETLISSLSQLPNLNVKPRSSVFRYKGKEADAQTIGKELNVQAILNGRVVQRGQDVSLFVELVDVAVDKVVWSQQYTRKQSHIVMLQSEIARDVSGKLKVKLSGTDVAKVEKNSRVSPEAYQLYLKGLFQLNRRTGDAFKQAADLFGRSIENDPDYAPAYAGRAAALQSFPIWGLALPKDTYPPAKAAALRALELDDSLADAHTVLGSNLRTFEWDWIGSEKEHRRAIELDLDDPRGYENLGQSLAKQKRFAEAIALTRRSVELDPLSKRGGLGEVLIYSRRYDEAISEMKAVLLLDPNYADTYWNLGKAYLSKGSYPEAITAIQRYLELDDDPVTRAMLAYAYAKTGNREEAGRQLDRLKQESSTRYVPAYAFALVHLGLNEKGEALPWLEKDVEDRTTWATYYAVDPLLDDVRDEPRFKALLKKMNFPE